MSGVAFDPAKFVREVRSEMTKVTWPSRKETLVTTGLVIGMAALAAIFFFLADQIIGVAVRALFVVGS
jgi:preprotein translocase subunit SecE